MNLNFIHHHETPAEQEISKPIKFVNFHNLSEPHPSIYWHPTLTEYYNSKYLFIF